MSIRLPMILCLLCALSTSARSQPDAATVQRRVDDALQEVQAAVTNRATFNGAAAHLEELLSDYHEALDASQRDTYRRALETARAEYAEGVAEEAQLQWRAGVESAEADWQRFQAEVGDWSPNQRDQAIADLQRDLEQLQREAGPDADAATRTRLAAVARDFTLRVGADASAAALAHWQETWARDAVDSEGWEDERPISLEVYASTVSAANEAFGMPKTLARYQLAVEQLARARELDAPGAWLQTLDEVRRHTLARLLVAAEGLVGAALAQTPSAPGATDTVSRLRMNLQGGLREDADPVVAELSRRCGDWIARAEASDTTTAEGLARWYRQMTLSAAAAWPQMEGQFKVSRGFDPTRPDAMEGQLIRLETDNLMGWRFKVGDFPFATTVNGLPVAAIYDGAVAQAIEDIEAKLGRALGDSDDDGRWTVIAEVTGQMGKMQRRVQVEGEVHDAASGEKLGTYRGEEAEAVDAPILRIVAAHVGPLAVAAGVGRSTADGTLERISGSVPGSRTGGGAAFGRFSGAVLLSMGALLVALRTWPQQAEARADAAGRRAELDRVRQQLPAVSAGVAIAGLLWLLVGGIVGDLLPALAMTACGAYGLLPTLRERQWLAAPLADRAQALGAGLAVGTLGVAVLHLGLGHAWLL